MKPLVTKIDSRYSIELSHSGQHIEVGILVFTMPMFIRSVSLETAQDLRDNLDAVISAAQLARGAA